jgi:hypothetical protein
MNSQRRRMGLGWDCEVWVEGEDGDERQVEEEGGAEV